jgi:hypothetical protein
MRETTSGDCFTCLLSPIIKQTVLFGWLSVWKFASGYPKSEKNQAAYLGAKKLLNVVRLFSLDQTDTFKAIDKLQASILIPIPEYLSDANEAVQVLSEKIEKKTQKMLGI